MIAAEEAKKKKAASTAGAAPSIDVGAYVKTYKLPCKKLFPDQVLCFSHCLPDQFHAPILQVSQIESDEEGSEDDGMGDIDAELADDAAADEGGDPGEDAEGGEDGGGEDEEPEEYIHVEQEFWYLERCINILGMIHCLFS